MKAKKSSLVQTKKVLLVTEPRPCPLCKQLIDIEPGDNGPVYEWHRFEDHVCYASYELVDRIEICL